MATWEEIRDEVAGMLADGQPLEDVLAKLEKRKNEMAKANLIAVMDEMKNPKPQTNEETRMICPICNNPLRQYGKDFYVCEVCETYFDKDKNIVLTKQEYIQTCNTEQLAEAIYECVMANSWSFSKDGIKRWLKQPHTNE